MTLQSQLNILNRELREYTKARFNRINPFAESLFAWDEKGRMLAPGKTNVRIYDSATIIGDVEIGNNVWIGPNTMIDGSGGLTIGDGVNVSAGAQIYTHDTVERCIGGGSAPIARSPVSIGRNTFIGAGAIILRGVKVGDGCVIAALSLVNRDVPDGLVVAGVPAKVLK